MKITELKEARSREDIDRLVDEVNELLEQSVDHAQSLTFELSPPILYELSFEDALGWLCEQMEDQHKMQITFEDDHELKPLGNDIRVVLFQAVRELLVNIVKHAHTKTASVSSRKDGTSIHIVVQDKGAGFDPVTIGAHSQRDGGFGLFNIRERLTHLGCHLEIRSAVGQGTRVFIAAPLKAEAQHSEGNPHES
jgi:signal transduction histidine kinase